MITGDDIKLYQRQIILEDIGLIGQQKIKECKIAVIGAGGLGCPVLIYLVSSGIGSIGIIDYDIVSIHNLHRQILYSREDINKNKAICASKKLKLFNPDAKIDTHNKRLTNKNAISLISQYDIIIDGSDNFETRYAVSDACAELNIPLVSGAIYKFEGQVSVFNYKSNYTYRDLFPNPPTNDDFNCSISGVIGSTCAVIAGFMLNEVFKIILDKGDVLSGKVLQINLLNMNFNIFKFNKNI